MKKLLCFTICVAFLLLQTSCSIRQQRHERVMKSTKAYVLENEELIRDAAEWILSSFYSEQEEWTDAGYTIRIGRSAKDEISARNYSTDEITVVKNAACETLLLDDGIFQYKWIDAHFQEDRQTVEFHVKGIGNTAYFYVVYVPSENVEDIWFFDSRLIYEETDGGFLGTQRDGDNSFFYLPLSDDLFYCEAYF